MSLRESWDNTSERRKRPGIQDGQDVERAIFGLPHIAQAEKREEYMPFREALEFARAHQPNPLERSRPLRNLRAKVVELCTDTTEPVKFITAIGTPLDIHHGIDGLFEQNGRIATVDISLREKEIYKADVLIVATLNEEGEVSISDDELEQAVQKIAARLNEQRQKRVA